MLHSQTRRSQPGRFAPRFQLVRLAVLAALTACSSTATNAAPTAPLAAADVAAADATMAPSVAAPQDKPFWYDDDFRRRFVESYLADSDVEPRITSNERDLLQDAMAKIGTDDFEGALSMLRSRQGKGSSAAIDYTLAGVLFQQERFDEAAAAYREAVAKFPKFRRAWKNLGLVLGRQGAHAEAGRALVRVIELGGADALTYGLLGFSLARGGDPLAAESAYRMAALLDPDTVEYRTGLARCFRDQRRFAEAASLCEALLASHSEVVDLWMLQAEAFIGQNELTRAAENLEFVDRLGGSTYESLALLGDVYVNADLPDLAASALERAIRRDPERPVDRALRAAQALGARGSDAAATRVADAIEAVQKGRLEPTTETALLRLRARIASKGGRSDEQAALLERIVQVDPLDGDALLALGQHHAERGDDERAVFHFERAAGIEGFEAKAKYQHARLLAKKGEYAAALPLLRRVQQVEPRDHVQRLLDQVERAAGGR